MLHYLWYEQTKHATLESRVNIMTGDCSGQQYIQRAETEHICSVITVCLLSVVLLLPYFARGHASVLVSSMGIAYSCLVLPMVISANYKYSVNGLRPMIANIKGKF
jgi:hypothetical protein